MVIIMYSIRLWQQQLKFQEMEPHQLDSMEIFIIKGLHGHKAAQMTEKDKVNDREKRLH